VRDLDSGQRLADATVAVIEREEKALNLSLHLVRSPVNLGFARANNEAYAALRAETPARPSFCSTRTRSSMPGGGNRSWPSWKIPPWGRRRRFCFCRMAR